MNKSVKSYEEKGLFLKRDKGTDPFLHKILFKIIIFPLTYVNDKVF